MSAPVRTERHDGVLEIVLDAPDRGNVINADSVAALDAAVADIAEGDRCVLLRAEGKNFCFGGDVTTFRSEDPGARLRELADALHDVLLRLDGVEIPVVGAVQGWATGAGFSLAVVPDVLVLAEGARFKSAYNALGFTADGGITYNLPRRAPRALTMDLMFSDRVLGADEALQHGIAARVVPDDELTEAARALAVEIAGKSRPATVAVKRLLRASPTAEYAEQLAAETDAISAAAAGSDGQEGIAAFLDRRAPRFSHH